MEALKNISYLIKNTLKNFIQKDKYLAALVLAFISLLIFLWGKFGDPIIDCGREAYIPYAMAFLDNTLFKDIICIYGPVPYYINAFVLQLLAIFGQDFALNLNTFYSIGAILSFVFLISFYNLLKRFFNAPLASLFCVVILLSCIFSPSISNFIFPYSYAVLYGLVFAVFHLHFLLKFIDNKNPGCLYIAAFFLSLCIFSKYDFVPCALVIILLMFFYRKNIDAKGFLYVLLSLFLVPATFFAVLLFQKVTLSDIIFNFKMMSNMAHSPSLQYFYSLCTGYFFDFKRTFMFLGQFLGSSLIIVFACILVNFASKIKDRYFSITIKALVCLFAAILLAIYFFRYVFLYIPLILVIFCIIKSVRFLLNMTIVPSDNGIKIYTIILFSILFSLKSLFGLFHELYGVFYLPFVLFAFYLIILSFFKTNKSLGLQILNTISVMLIMLFAMQNFKIFHFVKNNPVKTPSGVIFTSFSLAESMNLTIDYLKRQNPEKSLLVLPEGLFFNFVLKKNYPYFNTSFTPLDFDAYGEKYLTEQVLENLPDNILILGRSYSDYGKPFLCKDFGLKFCAKINDKYTFTRSFIGKANNSVQNEPQLGYQIYLFERKQND